jgi:hypothetical protein
LVVAGPEEVPLSSRIESWIEEIVQNRRETPPPPSGAEPLDLGEIEGALRAELPPDAHTAPM